MRERLQSDDLTLSLEDLDRFSEWLDEAQEKVGVEHDNCVRIRLLMEELLLRMHDRIGEEARLFAMLDFRLGRPRLRVWIEGKPCNPLGGVELELGEWDSSLRTAIGFMPQYEYVDGCNTLKMSLPSSRMNPVLRIAIAVVLGTAIGGLGSILLPANVRNSIVELVLSPTYGMWTRLLNAISGPIIFCTVATTMLNTRRIQERGGSSTVVIARYFATSIFVVAVALLCAVPLFHVGLAYLDFDWRGIRDAYDVLLQVVPSNIFEPFVVSNTSQLLFLAFALGYVLVKLGDKVTLLRQGVREANMVGLRIAEWVSWLVPVLTGVFICLEIWQGMVDLLADMWKPIVMALTISTITMGALETLLALRLRVSPATILRKVWPPFATAIRKGNLDESYAEVQSSCTKQLGIDADYVKVGLPQGLVLYMPISAVGTIVFTLFAARENGIQGDFAWYLSAIVLAVVVFVATPPVPGANLLAYVVLFQTLGIPDQALLDAMVFDIVFGIFANAANQTMLQYEMIDQASRLGLLDRETLKAKPTRQ